MAQEFLNRPSVQRFLMRFVGQKIVGTHILKTVRKFGRRFPFAFFDDYRIQKLLFQRKVLFKFHTV